MAWTGDKEGHKRAGQKRYAAMRAHHNQEEIREWCSRGGKAVLGALTPEQRRERGKAAAAARWAKAREASDESEPV